MGTMRCAKCIVHVAVGKACQFFGKLFPGFKLRRVNHFQIYVGDFRRRAGSPRCGVFKTENRGETWQEENKGFLKPFVSDIVIDRFHSKKLFAASEDGVYLSTNGGSDWRRVGIHGKGVRTVVQHPVIKDLFFAGTEDDGVFVSRDGGKSWSATNSGLQHLTVYSIACDRSNPDLLYAGTHGGGVYRSSDGGRSWNQKTEGLSNLVIHSLVVLPSNPVVLFAGTLNGGLFKSTDSGEHWNFNSQEEAQVWGLWAK